MSFEQRLANVVGRITSSGASLGRRAATYLPETLPYIVWPSPEPIHEDSSDLEEADHSDDDPGPDELPMPEIRPWRPNEGEED